RKVGKPASFEELAKVVGRDIGSVAKAAQWLSSKGLAEVEERIETWVKLGPEGEIYAERGLPERKLIEALKELGGLAELKELKSKLGEEIFRIGLIWAKKNRWIEIIKVDDKSCIKLKTYPEEEIPAERVLNLLLRGERRFEEIPENLRAVCLELAGRPGVIELVKKKIHILKPTELLMKLSPEELEVQEVTKLTQNLIASGKWKEIKLSRFDIRAPTPPIFSARRHPLQQLIKLIKEIFAEMGFEEIRGPLVELAFWNFDALFQPQDHPARAMHDTFYLAEPRFGDLPERFVESVRRAHEDGGDTGSIGWRYKWRTEEAKKLILRTHTTATTIRYLAEHRDPPIKVFSVDRIYRNERVDWRHLAEFHQIEGIVMDKDVCFRDLLGLIKEFYSKLGLKDVKFRPGYFPYTEPSAEAVVYLKDKGIWLELIGMGIFRPEVTLPLGVKYRVLAWGGGLERLALALYGLDDIRTFYLNDLNWIRGFPRVYLDRKAERI
ncbi:MAG: phenylalanine--tRNA ligase subunit alpha, partial [Thaumarchaeota archaeon]